MNLTLQTRFIFENADGLVNIQQWVFSPFELLLGGGGTQLSEWRHCLDLRFSLVSQCAPKSHIPRTEVTCLKRELFPGRLRLKCLGDVFLKESTVLSPPNSTATVGKIRRFIDI